MNINMTLIGIIGRKEEMKIPSKLFEDNQFPSQTHSYKTPPPIQYLYFQYVEHREQ